MRKSDAERRAFLRDLKPRLVAIGEAAALRSGLVDEAELQAEIAEGREEYQRVLQAERMAAAH